MKPKHTPGPWLINGNFVYALHNYNGRQVNRFSAAINHYPTQGGNAEEGEANARLIADAPDLLTHLEKVVSQFDALENNLSEADILVIGEAKAAIAKAIGETQ